MFSSRATSWFQTHVQNSNGNLFPCTSSQQLLVPIYSIHSRACTSQSWRKGCEPNHRLFIMHYYMESHYIPYVSCASSSSSFEAPVFILTQQTTGIRNQGTTHTHNNNHNNNVRESFQLVHIVLTEHWETYLSMWAPLNRLMIIYRSMCT